MATRLWTPADLTTPPRFWYDASDGRYVTRPGAGTAVTGLTNKGAVAKHLAQGTGTRQPTYSATSFNSKPGITSDGTSDVLSVATVDRNDIAGSSGNTVTAFWVKKYTSGTVWFKWESAVSNRFGLESGARWDMGDASTAAGQFTTFTDGTAETINCYYTVAGSPVVKRMRKNGTLDSNTQNLNAALTSTTASMSLFANASNANFSANVFAEMLHFNYELSSGDVEKVEGYLAHKWGKSGDLPSGHTYKSAAPTVSDSWTGPVIVNHGQTGSFGSGASGGTISMPFTPTSGNLLLAFLANDKGMSACSISGWTQVDISTSGTAVTGALFKKVSDGTETTMTTSITSPGGSGYVVTVVEIENADDVDVNAKVTTNASTATRTSGTATTAATTAADELAIAFWCNDSYLSCDGGADEAFTNSFERLAGSYSRGYYTLDPSGGGAPAVSMGQLRVPTLGSTPGTSYSYTGDATDENILFLAVVGTPNPPPAISTLTDDFDTIDTAVWDEVDSGSFLRSASGKLEIDNDTTYPNLTTDIGYDLVGDSIFINLEYAGASSGGTGREIGFFVVDAGNTETDQFGFIINEGNIIPTYGIAGSFSYPTGTTWDASTKGWLRIREASGTAYLEYASTYNGSYTTLYSRAAFAWMSNAKVRIYAGHWNGGETPLVTSVWDNLNQAPSTNHSVTPNTIASGSPTVGNPALTQNHVTSETGVSTGAPTVGQPALTQNHAVTPTGVSSGAPVVGTPTWEHQHVTGPSAVAAGSPTVGTPALTQNHALVPSTISAGSPTVGTPTATEQDSNAETDPGGISAGSPTVGQPALSQTHAFNWVDVATGAPTVGQPALAQTHVLVPTGVATGEPTVGAPALTQNHGTGETGVSTGNPTVGQPALTQNHALAPVGVSAGAPIVGLVTLDPAEGGGENPKHTGLIVNPGSLITR